MSDKKNSIDIVGGLTGEGLGERLRLAREAAGLEVSDVAESLHVTSTYVHALEQNNFEKLPGLVFVRGYIKTYARLLHLPVDELVRQFEMLTEGTRQEPIRAINKSKVYDVNTRSSLGVWFGLIGIMVVILPSLGWWFSHDDGLQNVFLEKTQTNSASLNHAIVTAAPSGEIKADASVPATISSAVVTTAPTSLPSLLKTTPIANTVDNKASQTVEPTAVAAVKNNNDKTEKSVNKANIKTVDVEFTKECWLQITDKSGATLHEALHKAGDKISVSGESPLRLWMGNTKGVVVRVNGKPIQVATETGTSSAHFVVGQ